MMGHFVYMIECADGSLYTGYSTDPEKRFKAHRAGKGARYTRSRKPVRIVYLEEFATRNEALSREWHIKKMRRADKKQLIEKIGEMNHNSSSDDHRRILMTETRFYRCPKCKKIVLAVHPHGCPTVCCGEAMVELTANTTDAAVEKHVPAVTIDGCKVIVNVGDVDHPMLDNHYIEFIALETAKGISIVYLKPGDAPHAEFLTEDKPLAVYEFCNLHGLWKKEL